MCCFAIFTSSFCWLLSVLANKEVQRSPAKLANLPVVGYHL